ncbi:MAG: VWA domain-containing protein, partial [Tissierellia bacterium]|nr:VWA domain-containing protein [Tissierellia bacterium]
MKKRGVIKQMNIDNLFKNKENDDNTNPKIIKKGAQIMNKNMFKRVISFVIAMMLILPNLPMNLVKADESLNQSGDLSTVNVTTEAAIQLEPIKIDNKTLLVKHNYIVDGEIASSEYEEIEGLKVGEEFEPPAFALEVTGFKFIESDLLTIVISESEMNEVNLFYEEIVVEDNSSDGPLDIKLNSMNRMALLDSEPSQNEPGAVFIDKTAEWVDEANGIAKIKLNLWGNPVITGSDVVLVLDRSGSMSSNQRLSKTKTAAKAFVEELYKPVDGVPSDNRVLLVTFNTSAEARPRNTNNNSSAYFIGESDSVGGVGAQDYLDGRIEAMIANGYTSYVAPLNAANTAINNRSDITRPTYIVFMSDGEPNTGGNGQSTATTIKNGGTKIFALGLGLSNNAFNNYIVPLASTPTSTYSKIISDDSDLTTIFTGLAGDILIAGKNAIVTDYINTDNFTVTNKPETSISFEPSDADVTIDIDGKVTWNVGDITKNPKELWVYIRLNNTVIEPGQYNTNFSADLEYVDYKDTSNTKVYPMPQLPIGNIGQINMKYYLVNDQGKPLDTDGITEVTFPQRVDLKSELFEYNGNSDLPLNIQYDVQPPSTIELDGLTYEYVPLSADHGGSPSQQNVTLLANNKIRIFNYGYMLQELNPELTINKSTTAASYGAVGNEIEYSYLVTNSGNVTLNGVFVVTDDKVTVDMTGAPSTLAPGASFIVTAAYVVTQADINSG